MMKSKPKFLLSLVFLLIHQTTPGECNIDKSKVKSFVVTRRSQNFDLFTVNMKSNHRCDSTWCTLMEGFHIWENGSSCSCTCHAPKFTFAPVMQRCIDASQAASFGGIRCAQAGYFNRQTLLNYPVVLKDNGKTREFSVSNVVNCSGNYYVYDYTGFQDNWKTLADNFFTIKVKRRSGFEIEWKKDDKGKYSGRIIRIVVTCTTTSSSLTRCILLKAVGPVTYSAPPASSSTNIGHSSPVGSHVSLLSATPSIVTKSSSLSVSLTVSPSSSSLLQTSASSPPSTTSMPSSPARSSSLFPYRPSSSSASSTLSPSLSPLPLPLPSPSPSLVLTSSTGTLGVPQSDSSFLPLTQSQTARLPAITTGQIQATTSAVIMPIEPAETTTAVSSSSAADSGPGDRGTQTGGNDNGDVIGAAVGGAVFVGISVIIVIVFWKRRKSCESTEKRTKPVKNPVYESSENAIQLEAPKGSQTMPSITQGDQPTHQSLINDNGKSNEAAIYSSADDEYDNCTVHVYQSLDKQIPGTPVYGKLNKSLPEPSHTTGEPKPKLKAKTSAAGMPNFEANGVTGLPKPKPATTGKPSNRPIVAHENVCNVIDGPGTGQGTTPEPLYNVLKVTDNPVYEQTLAFDAPYAALHRPGMQRESVYEPGDLGKTCKNPLYESIDQSDNQHSAC